jgi:hypothetical protein
MVDPEPAPCAAAAGVAEPGVFTPVTMLSSPEIDEAGPRELRKASARLEAVVLGIDVGRTRIEVTQHDERPCGAASQPRGRRVPEGWQRRTLGRSVHGGDARPAPHELHLEPTPRIDAGLRGRRLGYALQRYAGQHTESTLLRASWRAETMGIPGPSEHVAEIGRARRNGLLQHDDIRVVALK